MESPEALKTELRLLVSALRIYVRDAREGGDELAFIGSPKLAKDTAGVFPSPALQVDTPRPALSLASLKREIGDCRRCGLSRGRRTLVFGEGRENAELVFVGEGPGEDEDKMGRPFVGRAGQLLTKIIAAMGMSREDVYICNVVKCRPPNNRVPTQEEIAACEPFLARQLEVIKPKIICALGASAAQTLLKSDVGISVLRGNFHSYQGIPVMPTYHPAYLLRNPGAKKQVWQDMQKIMEKLKGR